MSLFILCLFILSIFNTGCGGGRLLPPNNPIIPIPAKHQLELSQTEFTLNVGYTDNITVTLNGEDITQTATYTVDEKAIASVEQGIITGHSAGFATVTVHAENAEEDKTFTVNVIDPSLPTLEVTPSEVNLGVIDETTVTVTLEGKDVTKEATYKSNDKSIATAEKGKVTAGIVEGTAKIAVSLTGANSGFLTVNVTDDTEKVTLNNDILDQLHELGYIAKGSANKAELTEANIPAIFKYNDKKYKITSIADNLFQYCSALTIITIPDTVTSIGKFAFYGCSLLENITIPDLVTYIASGTFSNCSSLTNVNIGDCVLCIFPYSFYNCDNLTKITTKSGTINIESGYYKNNNVTFIYVKQDQSNVTGNIEIPSRVTEIPYAAFYNIEVPSEECSGLTSITIPDSVTTIGEYAFCNCTNSNLSIAIPNSVTIIGYYAFKEVAEITYDQTQMTATGSPWGAKKVNVVAQ